MDYEALALKHWTSKLTTFEDLQTVHSFGFRGEALSSLCALSRVSVCTRTVEDATATLLTFNTEGKLVGQKPIAREKGTTVSCENLFETLPVRAKEFQKHIKRSVFKLVFCSLPFSLMSDCPGSTPSCSIYCKHMPWYVSLNRIAVAKSFPS